MMSILSKLSVNLQSITPHISEATNGIIAKLGLASVATGGTSAIVTKAVVTQDAAWISLSDAVAIASVVGSIMFVVNVTANVYFARKKDRREEAEQKRNVDL
jgi:hypothetical protein